MKIRIKTSTVVDGCFRTHWVDIIAVEQDKTETTIARGMIHGRSTEEHVTVERAAEEALEQLLNRYETAKAEIERAGLMPGGR